MTSNLCVIPARMASGRFPGKPLVPLLGLPLVLHVYERCRLCPGLERIVVATCDDEIMEACRRHGAEAVMTAASHPGCVDRTDEALRLLVPDADDGHLVVMVQGDEVLLAPEMVTMVLDAHAETGAPVINVASRLHRDVDHDDPNTVKVAAAPDGRALYLSRAAIPSRARDRGAPAYQQTGVIGFSAPFLRLFGTLPRTPIEKIEQVDMMRVLEHGHRLQMVFTERETIGVDTPADRDRAEEMLRADPVTRRYLEF